MSANRSFTSLIPAPGLRQPIFRMVSLVLLLCLLAGMTGCQVEPVVSAWTLDDLRLLDPVDASTPSADILALYTRTRGPNLEIRLDLLDTDSQPDYDLELIFISGEEVVLRIPAHGNPVISNWLYGLHVTIERDPDLDTLVIHLNRLFIPRDGAVQVKTYLPGQENALDSTELVSLQAPSLSTTAGVLFAFWDVFPATTPAQALRRWAGAHTGPYGTGHGLNRLLNGVEKYELPVFLLDLLNPASLAALQFTDGALAQVQRLVSTGLVTLSLSACGQPPDVALDFSRRSALDFGLPESPFLYTCGSGLQPGYPYQFIALDESSRAARMDEVLLLTLPNLEDEQATGEGPSLQVRRLLVEAALSSNPGDFLVLGGSLPASTWAGSEQAAVSLAWLAGHPWINVLDSLELIFSSFAADAVSASPSPPAANPWLEALQSAPDNALTRLAWQMNLLLTSPTAAPGLQALRQAYAGQLGILLSGALWAEEPYSRVDCSVDPDADGLSECLLADEHYFAVLETAGARLTHLFYLDEQGPHQLIAPTTQFTIGMSDPSLWQPELGDAADPGALVGAFSDLQAAFAEYEPFMGRNFINLVADGVRKRYQLTGTGLEITYTADATISFRLPLAVDPQVFYSSSGSYISASSPGSWTWGVADGLQVQVRTTGSLSAAGFIEAQPFLAYGEDPDEEYPYIHFFPFPFSLAEITGSGRVVTTIEVK